MLVNHFNQTPNTKHQTPNTKMNKQQLTNILYWYLPKVILIASLFYSVVDSLIKGDIVGLNGFKVSSFLIFLLMAVDQIRLIYYKVTKDNRFYDFKTFRYVNLVLFTIATMSLLFLAITTNVAVPSDKWLLYGGSVLYAILASHDYVIIKKSKTIHSLEPNISDFGVKEK